MSNSSHLLDSLFPLTGTGLLCGKGVEIAVEFSCEILDDCSMLIKTSAQVDSDVVCKIMNDFHSTITEYWNLQGTTENGFTMECAILDQKKMSCSTEVVPSPLTMELIPKCKVFLNRNVMASCRSKRLVFGILNLQKEVKNTLRFRLGKYDVLASAVQDYDSIEKKLKKGEIPRAITHEVFVELDDMTGLDEVEEAVLNLTLMLSIIKHNEIRPLYLIRIDRNSIPDACTIYSHLQVTEFNSFFKMIDDEYVRNGTELYINGCFDNFCYLHEIINLWPFIHGQMFVAKNAFLHLDILVLILGIEYVITHFGREFLEWNPEEEMNLIQKLGRLNKHVRGIRNGHLPPNFLTSVRNPLIHIGSLLDLSHDELWKICRDLHRLTALIYLKLLGYTGKYLGYDWPPTIFQME